MATRASHLKLPVRQIGRCGGSHRVRMSSFRNALPASGGENFHFAIDNLHRDRSLVGRFENFGVGMNGKSQRKSGNEQNRYRHYHFHHDEGAGF